MWTRVGANRRQERYEKLGRPKTEAAKLDKVIAANLKELGYGG